MGAFFGTFFLLLALGVGGMIYLFASGNGDIIFIFPQRMMAGVDQFILADNSAVSARRHLGQRRDRLHP